MAIRWIAPFFQRNQTLIKRLIVESALYDFDPLVRSGADYPINETMFASNPPRPVSGQFALQRFRFADAAEWAPLNVLDQSINLQENVAVATMPTKVFLPCERRPKNVHLVESLWRLNLPALACAMLRNSLRALRGLLVRCSVSSMA
jgi:hypothetical protein